MNKKTYLDRLRRALEGVPREDAEKLLEYYRELIDDRVESGLSEEEAVSELEPPEIVADNFRRETGAPARTPEKHEPTEEKVSKVLLAILGIIIAFVGAVFLFALGVSAFSILVSGIFVFTFSFGLLVISPAEAFLQMGTGILLLGIGLLLFAAVSLVGRGYSRLLNELFGSNKPQKPFRTRRSIPALCVGGALCVLGILFFTASFGALGFQFDNLAYTGDVVTKEEIITDEFDSFSLDSDNLALEVFYSENEETRFVWREWEQKSRTYSYSNGKITLTSPYHGLNGLWTTWWRGIFFSAVAKDFNRAELYLPASYRGGLTVTLKNGSITAENMVYTVLSVKTNNGKIRLSQISADVVKADSDNGAVTVSRGTIGQLTAETDNGAVTIDGGSYESIEAKTNNGAVAVSYATVEKTLSASTDNGTVKLDSCTAQKIVGDTDNGTVSVQKISADEIILTSGNGSVRGTISGSRENYRIDAKTSVGKCNLENKTSGEKSLYVRTGAGKIDIEFVS